MLFQLNNFILCTCNYQHYTRSWNSIYSISLICTLLEFCNIGSGRLSYSFISRGKVGKCNEFLVRIMWEMNQNALYYLVFGNPQKKFNLWDNTLFASEAKNQSSYSSRTWCILKIPNSHHYYLLTLEQRHTQQFFPFIYIIFIVATSFFGQWDCWTSSSFGDICFCWIWRGSSSSTKSNSSATRSLWP